MNLKSSKINEPKLKFYSTAWFLLNVNNDVFFPGISKKPFYKSPCRIINNKELPVIVGNTTEKSGERD